MNEGTLGILILISVSIGSALVSHWLIRRYIIACFYAALVADVIFQVAAYLHLGHLDPFILITIFTAGGIAFIIAVFIGIPFALIRRRRKAHHVV